MGSSTITTAGCTKPSSTSLGYQGSSGTVPPASGNDPSVDLAEWTTAQYTQASAQDSSYVTFSNNDGNYPCLVVKLLIPVSLQGTTFTRIDYGIVGASAGNQGVGSGPSGYKLYILKVPATKGWELVGTAADSTTTTLTGFKTASITNYIDANYRIALLAEGTQTYDSNGGGCFMTYDYVYVTLTYAGGAFSSTLPLLGVG